MNAPIDANNLGAVKDLQRAALEARLNQAVQRVRKNYLQTSAETAERPPAAGPQHLGTRIDIRA